jgi:3D (Asp-Asp-Asp) domain-containing protein
MQAKFIYVFSVIMMLFAHAVSAQTVQGLKLRNTHYYVVLESQYLAQPKTAQILDLQGGVIAEVSAAFKRAVEIEGTGRLADGRIINFAGRVNKETRYLVTDAPFGLGVGRCQLRPFRTVAVDSSVVALGSVVMIDETVGMRLPDGTVHDGLWRTDDIGSAIKRDRIDLFVGDGDRGDVLRAHGITHLMPLTITVVEQPGDDSCVNP